MASKRSGQQLSSKCIRIGCETRNSAINTSKSPDQPRPNYPKKSSWNCYVNWRVNPRWVRRSCVKLQLQLQQHVKCWAKHWKKIEMKWDHMVRVHNQRTSKKAISKRQENDDYASSDTLGVSGGRWAKFLELFTPSQMGYQKQDNYQVWWPNVVRYQQE